MLVVCPNPTIDRQVFVDAVVPGSVSRASSNRALAGGKPVDAIRAMQAHGVNPPLFVLLPQQNPGYLGLLADEEIEASAFEVPGAMRETIVLFEDSGQATVINGQGVTVSDYDWYRFCEAVRDLAADEDWVVVSGSFPPGVSDDGVRALIGAAHSEGARVALDTGPSWMAAALPAKPDLITPNLAEALQTLTGTDVGESVEVDEGALEHAAQAARDLVATGIPFVVVTAGSAGTAWATGSESGHYPIVAVDVKSPIGAGDSMIGGMMAKLTSGATFSDAVAWGVATAASAVQQWIPGRASADDVAELRARLSDE